MIEVGTALTKELENVYGIKTVHDKSVYDMVDGQLDRNAAYNFAGDSVEAALRKNPSVKVVIDLHRDSVENNIHLAQKSMESLQHRLCFLMESAALQVRGISVIFIIQTRRQIWHSACRCSFYVENIIQI